MAEPLQEATDVPPDIAEGPVSTEEVALFLGVGARRVRALIREGRIKAIWFGSAWMIQNTPDELMSIRKTIEENRLIKGEGRPDAPRGSEFMRREQ